MALFRRKNLVIVLAILVLGAGLVWWQRGPMLAWYYVRQLATASEENRDDWVNRVVEFDVLVVPGLLDCLARNDARACGNVEAALMALCERWGPDDARALSLVEEIQGRLQQWSPSGKQAGLNVPLALLRAAGTPADRLAEAAGKLVQVGALDSEPLVQAKAILLATVLIERSRPGQWLDLGRHLALGGLAAPDADVRFLAVNLALHIARRSDQSLLEKVVPLLRDPVPTVRRAALLAVGPAQELLPVDEILPLLHDSDAEVRRLCELTLRSRGFPDNHIEMARDISHPEPLSRLKVLDHLLGAPELEPGVWLLRMTHDLDSAVRAAAVRAACKDFRVDLRERIRQMAQNDPSDTVRQIARTYLNQPARRIDE